MPLVEGNNQNVVTINIKMSVDVWKRIRSIGAIVFASPGKNCPTSSDTGGCQ